MSRLRKLPRLLGLPFSPLYAGVMALRALLYRRGLLKSERLPVPVVCVGNLSMGGTGKTPLVMAVVRLLLEAGLRPAVVSRGYRGGAKASVNVVSDGRAIRLDAGMAGDEPRLLAESLPGVPVLTARKRVLAGWRAVREFQARVIVLDDGFQHLALARDLDLVLFNARSPLERSRVFPAGELRESFAGLKRAHAVLISGVDEQSGPRVQRFRHFLQEHFPGLPVFEISYRPVRVRRGDRLLSVGEIRGLPLLGFCGIAMPGSFRQSLEALGCLIKGFQAFPDHHRYGSADAAFLVKEAQKAGTGGLITTEKDGVKIRALKWELPVYILEIEPCLEENFVQFLAERSAGWQPSGEENKV